MRRASGRWRSCSTQPATVPTLKSCAMPHSDLNADSAGHRVSPTALFPSSTARSSSQRLRPRFNTGSGVFAGTPDRPRTAYYQRLCCTFDGLEKDLHPKQADWPELVHDHDYAFCNGLGAEAIRSELDGLVSPSARRHGGANMPIFRRQAIRNPQSQGLAPITCDVGSPTAKSDAPHA